MSDPLAITSTSGARPDVHTAIASAAARTGVDFDYLLAQARIESGLDPRAQARTSSAAGLYQFTAGTWLATLERHGAEHGIATPATRSAALAMRLDPDASALMAAELASDNRTALSGQLGREPDATELYLAHFLGAGGASRFLAALQATPDASAAALLPEAAAANRAIFYDGDTPRSLAGVMDLMRGKMAGAMGTEAGASADWTFRPAASPGPAPALQDAGGLAQASPPRPSMAEILRTAFGGSADSAGEAPAVVRNAYARLKAFNL